ncbi:MAG: amino acid ABC transporter permease [Leptolyngbyaceae bacterium]|nr:amino acid ABC transporter permease [Leptolyngbyaceae bacterium]
MRDFSYLDILWALLWASRWTLLLSAVAFAGGGIAGFLLLLMRISPLRGVKYLSWIYCECVQGIPLLILLVLVFFGLSILGLEFSPWTSATIALTTYSGAFWGDIWRGAVEAVPRGQWEASKAMSFNYGQQLGLVILPQAVRFAIAPTVGFIAQLIKGTSLASAIGFVELARTATNITNVTFEPFVVYLTLSWEHLSVAIRSPSP